ncbi:unnamed protein product, partial [Nesidiocoris tenuis]
QTRQAIRRVETSSLVALPHLQVFALSFSLLAQVRPDLFIGSAGHSRWNGRYENFSRSRIAYQRLNFILLPVSS